MADVGADNGALHSSSDASNSPLQGAAPVPAVHLADAHHKRSLLLKYLKKWHAVNRKRRAQWKKQLLATHHAHYARLWSAFDVWRQRTSKTRRRKQVRLRRYAVCYDDHAVNSKSRQRVLLALASSSGFSSGAGEQSSPHPIIFEVRALSRYFDKWKAVQRESRKKHSLANRNPNGVGRATVRPRLSRQLRVQGAAIRRVTLYKVSSSKLQAPPALTPVAQLQSTAWRALVESRCKREFFKRWRSSVSSVRRELEEKAVVAAKILHFQFQQVIQRWKRRLVSARERALLEKRAYFFLYFCLTKKSLTQLKKYAVLRKREHLVTSMVERGVKTQALRKLVALSRQRRNLRRVFAAWQNHISGKQNTERPETQTIKLLVYNKYRSRLLQEAFRSWRDRYLQKQVYASVIRVVQQFRVGAIRLAWSQWRQLVIQTSRIQQWHDNHRARALHQVWIAWELRTHGTRKNEMNRRLAVRFAYRRLLTKGFASFLIAVQHTRQVAEIAETMRNDRFKSVLVNCFAGWKTLPTRKKLLARKHADAARLYEARLLNRVWKLGWRRFISSKTAKRTKLETAVRLYDARFQQRAFQGWKEEWADRRRREELLSVKATHHLESKNRQRKERVFQLWLEYVRKRQTSRLVSAHARGTWQVKLLRTSLSSWMARVSELRWNQIQDQRARQHRDAKLKQKCFQFWKRKLAALQHYRAQNRKALIHWKLAVEKKAFAGLKEYVARKKHERARMHDALEFRHRLIVSDGMWHWMTASLHLQAQRENHASQSQAQHAARVWRTVARIARHWRALAVSRRVIRSNGPQVNASTYGRSNALRVPESWLRGQDRKRLGGLRAPPIPVGKENRDVQNVFRTKPTNAVAAPARSPLSEFVTLPKNRPQPRRPIGLLVANAALDELREHLPPEAKAYNAEAGDLHTKYGFEFPAQPFQSLEMHSQFQAHQIPLVHEMRAPLKKIQVEKPQVPPSTAHRPAKRSTLSQLDALEAQLQVWRTRKQELKTLQVKIENYRHQLQNSSYQSPSLVRQMQLELSTTEKQYTEFSNKWVASKERIRTVNQEILRLHAALQQA